jgi:Prophage CP4-57 regulatory protein (AlpA)
MFVRYKYLEENGIIHDRVALARAIENLGFPKPIALGPNTLAWRLSEVEDWIQSRPRVSTKANALRSRGPKPLPAVVTEAEITSAAQ